MGGRKRKPPLGKRLVQRLADIRDTLKSGEPLEEKFTVRRVVLDLEPKVYDSEDVRALRAQLGVSQQLFAQIVGASVDTIASWEQGIRTPTPMARRLLEEIGRNPQRWRRVLRDSVTEVQM